jgi:hypothetical protein
MQAYCAVQVGRGRTTMMDLYVRIDKRGMTMHSFINTWGSDRTQ